jgi:predicted lactoylglutathione lyase
MTKYPIKILKDEHNNPFVPMVSAESIHTNDGKSFEDKLAAKLEASNLKNSSSVVVVKDGDDCSFEVNFGASDNIIDNLNTTVAGQGPLDARQGNVLKNMIPEIVDNLETVDATKVLSAKQGYELNQRVVPTGGEPGQVLKRSDDGESLEWGDAADPNAIGGDGSIMKIIELTYAEYKTLESNGELQEDTEYHITDVENGTATYLTTNQIQTMIENNVINNTNSDSTTQALSAAKGKELQNAVDSLREQSYKPSQLIGEVTATGFVSKLTLDNLNLTPGVYEIIYAEFSNKSTGTGHVMRINGLTSGYQGIHMHPADMKIGASGMTWRIAYHGNGLAYVNGWSQGTGLCYGVYTLHYFNKDWITVTGESHIVLNPTQTGVYDGGVDGGWNILYQQGSYNGHVTNSINSISLEPLDDSLIGTGSYIRIYKK